MPYSDFRARALPALLGALLLSTALAPASAQSLMERRNAIQKGTSEGIVIIGGPKDDTTQGGDKQAAGTDATTADAGKPTGLRSLFDKLQPPSGCPLGAARNAECPDQGIAVPTGEPSSSNTPNFSR